MFKLNISASVNQLAARHKNITLQARDHLLATIAMHVPTTVFMDTTGKDSKTTWTSNCVQKIMLRIQINAPLHLVKTSKL